MKDLAIHPKVLALLIGLAITSAIGTATRLGVEHEVLGTNANGTNGTNANGTNGTNANGTNGTSNLGANGISPSLPKSGIFS